MVAKRYRRAANADRTAAILHRSTGAVLFVAQLTAEAGDPPPARRLGLALELALKAQADLTGADLRGALAPDLEAFEGIVARADLSGADISCAELVGCDLAGAALTGAILKRASFKACDLRGADLSSADLCEAQFEFCDLRDVVAASPQVGPTYFWHVRFEGARLTGFDPAKIVLRECSLPDFAAGEP